MLPIPEIEDLIFKGGSVKGVAYLGVKAALDACGFDFSKVKRVAINDVLAIRKRREVSEDTWALRRELATMGDAYSYGVS